MAVAEKVDVQEASSATVCPGCHKRDRRIEELESELRRYQRRSIWRTHAILLVGSLLLVTVPPLFVWCVLMAAEMSDSLHPVISLVFYGVVWGGLFSPWAVFGICAMLSWRPLWQRGLIFPPAFAAAGAAICLLSIAVDTDFGLGLSQLALFPMLVLIALPCFVVRMWRRWTLAPLDGHVSTRPPSIATLMVATSLCAAAAACLRGFDPGEGVSSPMGNLGVLLVTMSYLGLPVLCIGLALTLCVRVTLANKARRTWLASYGLIVGTPLGSACVAAAMCFMVKVNGQPIPWEDVLGAI